LLLSSAYFLLVMSQLQRIVISSNQLQDQTLTLTAEQKHYLSRVLRLGSGDQFIAMNGQGQSWLAKLTADAAHIVKPAIAPTELPFSISLIAAPPKGNGFEEVIRQVTELGVTTIQPVITQRTVLQPSLHKLERWQRIAQEAAEQSERQIVPAVLPPITFDESLEFSRDNLPSFKYLCVTRIKAPHLLTCLQEHTNRFGTLEKASPSIVMATGPEGGWTDPEVEAAIAVGFQPVSLGTRILRAVTAPIVGIALIAAVGESCYRANRF
jgi:16S rRNA (uracil1498-N3)-methyltransferase